MMKCGAMWGWSLGVVLAAMALPLAPPGPVQPRKVTAEEAEMALVPAGEFWMGSMQPEVNQAIEDCKKERLSEAFCRRWFERELPRHRVMLDAFYIDRHEVTNGLFERFVKSSGHRTTAEREGHGWIWEQKDGRWLRLKVDGAAWTAPTGPGSSAPPTHPVVQVSWYDADAYCGWASKRLPTEAEWEKAARGADGRRYPWGDAWDASRGNAVMTVGTTTPVGSYPGGVSPYTVHDMAGSVWEWVADWFDPEYYGRSPERNPKGPDRGQRKLLRGGSWDDYPVLVRTAFRNINTPGYRTYGVGFRCAKDATP